MEVQLTPEAQAILDRLVASGSKPDHVISLAIECLAVPEFDEAEVEEIVRKLAESDAAIARGDLVDADAAFFERLRQKARSVGGKRAS